MHLYCIADPDTVRGFRLAGVPGWSAATPQEAAAALTEATARADCALVVVTEDLAEALRPRLERLRGQGERPLMVAIPGPGGPAPGGTGLHQLVRKAVGASLEPEPW